ncbi:neurotrophin 1 isoform X2 [Phymastichus coffea]|uniref:neurotrophin 1 isoform X2 n=1 Tax=Phymastichus coffea TaxID=108790 RepID=UPI00273CCDF2|nr:neurotrophin 1 isoform X2 [Phymastichus coffea]
MRTSTAAGLILLTLVVSLSVGSAEENARAEHELHLQMEEEDEDEPEDILAPLRLDLNASLVHKLSEIQEGVPTVEPAVAVANSTDNSTEPSSRTARENFTDQPDDDEPEALPEPMELRYSRPEQYRRRPYYAPPTRRSTHNRRNVYHDKPPPGRATRPTRRPSEPKREPTENECTFFSKTVCLEAVDYPMEAIMRSIRKNKEMVAALLTDIKVQDVNGVYEEDDVPQPSYKTSYDNRYDKRYESRFETSNEIKRKFEYPFENAEEGFTCPSQVKYARPQLARAASGVWKYIINTGEHTQTLRLEKCSNPKTPCSFISENYRSSCMQVYNYHRLLTWDSKLGLHMDIFKVPTCCSCHVHGYTDLFPPHQTDPPYKMQELFPGADFAINDHHLSSSSNINKYPNAIDSAAFNLFRESYAPDQDETQLQHSSSSRRPSLAKPPRRKPSNPARPFDKLPTQHAPNTRAPGYKGGRPLRPLRPFRRESAVPDLSDYQENSSNITLNRFSPTTFEQDAMEPSSRLQNGGFDEEYQETQRRVNYNYHPIIDFFKPEAAMLKAEESMQTAASTSSDSWKPILKP